MKDDISRFQLFCLGLIFFRSQTLLSFDFEHTRLRLFQKLVVHTKLDIYVFVTNPDSYNYDE